MTAPPGFLAERSYPTHRQPDMPRASGELSETRLGAAAVRWKCPQTRTLLIPTMSVDAAWGR